MIDILLVESDTIWMLELPGTCVEIDPDAKPDEEEDDKKDEEQKEKKETKEAGTSTLARYDAH